VGGSYLAGSGHVLDWSSQRLRSAWCNSRPNLPTTFIQRSGSICPRPAESTMGQSRQRAELPRRIYGVNMRRQSKK
jgi:hypothetical protein